MERRWRLCGGNASLFRDQIQWLLDQRADEAEQLLLLWAPTAAREKSPDLDIDYLAARRKIGFVSNQHSARFGIPNETSPVPVCTAVKFSHVNGHHSSSLSVIQYRNRGADWGARDHEVGGLCANLKEPNVSLGGAQGQVCASTKRHV
jgi:hypothetical protein